MCFFVSLSYCKCHFIRFFSSCSRKHNTLTQEKISAGWVLLFDGESMNGNYFVPNFAEICVNLFS